MEGPLFNLLHACTVRVDLSSGHGTGFFVAPGLILTCAHVIEDAKNEASHIRIYYNRKTHEVQRIIKSLPTYPDLALLSVDLSEHPCVYLDAAVAPRDDLYTYGYTKNHPDGESTTLDCEGLIDGDQVLLKLKAGQVLPGSSGSPLLNMRTGGVCGIMKLTRDRTTDLGGGAIPTEVIFSSLTDLVEQNKAFHRTDRR